MGQPGLGTLTERPPIPCHQSTSASVAPLLHLLAPSPAHESSPYTLLFSSTAGSHFQLQIGCCRLCTIVKNHIQILSSYCTPFKAMRSGSRMHMAE